MANPAMTRSFRTALAEAKASPNAVPVPPMSINGVLNKTGAMFLLLLASAGVTVFVMPQTMWMPAALISSLAALGVGLWASFSRKVMPALYLAYAALEGVVIGAISAVMNIQYPGIVNQAVLATLLTAAAIFFAWKTGIIKVTDKFRKFMIVGLFAYLGFSLINLFVSLFTGTSVYFTEFGWAISLVGVALAALTLSLDFQAITVGIREGLPAENEWRGAFGLTVSLVWLYMEILRFLGIMRS